MHHIIEAQQFDRTTLEQLFRCADARRAVFDNGGDRRAINTRFCGRLMFNVFYEPSTRTRMSFAAAAQHLGMEVVNTENARDFSSAIKGESLEDTIRVLNGYYPDIIVLRHHEDGAAERAARVSAVPIINAGDGGGQHPTQALLDLYTIQQQLGRIAGLTVVMGGDLANGRTVRSLAYLLAKYTDIHIVFVSPPALRMGDDLKQYLLRKQVPFREEDDLQTALASADVVYWTRVQKERLPIHVRYEDVCGRYMIDVPQLQWMKPGAILMHPLPRVTEITTAVDDDPRAVYFRQASNGMFVRMALIEHSMEGRV